MEGRIAPWGPRVGPLDNGQMSLGQRLRTTRSDLHRNESHPPRPPTVSEISRSQLRLLQPQDLKDRPKERRPPHPLVFSLPNRDSLADSLEAELLEEILDTLAVGATIGEILEGHVQGNLAIDGGELL